MKAKATTAAVILLILLGATSCHPTKTWKSTNYQSKDSNSITCKNF